LGLDREVEGKEAGGQRYFVPPDFVVGREVLMTNRLRTLIALVGTCFNDEPVFALT